MNDAAPPQPQSKAQSKPQSQPGEAQPGEAQPAQAQQPGAGISTSALLNRLPGVEAFDLTVVSSTPLTPSMTRIRLTAEGIGALSYEAGQDLMLGVPADQQHFRRRYTIRRLHRPSSAVDLDIVLHGDGPGARWAAAASPGDRVEALGPRGKVTLVHDADWHLFACDESGAPATFAMVEALPAGARAIALVEIGGPTDEPPFGPVSCDFDLSWVHRSDAPGTSADLARALASLTLPGGRGHAYLAGELRQVAAARSALLDKGMATGDIDHKAYWRLGVANAAHGEPERPA